MSKLLPYETIVKAHEGDPDAIDTVLSHYAGYIRYFSKINGQVNSEVADYVKPRCSNFALTVELYPMSDKKKIKLIFKPSHCME